MEIIRALMVVVALVFYVRSSMQAGDTVTAASAETGFPYLSHVPATGFTCRGRPAGYYADDHPDAQCQVFHYCHHDGREFNFLCPNKTVFNQRVFACDHYYNFNCSTARQFYSLNEVLFGISVEDDVSN